MVGTVMIILTIVLIAQPWGAKSPGGITSPMAPPPLSVTIIPAVIFLALLAGILMMLGLAFGNRFARSIASIASILFGLIGIYFGLYALLVDISDLFHVNGIIPVFGLIMGMAAIKRRYRHRQAAVIGVVLCLSALALDTIFVITYPAPRIWIIIATVAIPVGIIIYAFYSKIKGYPGNGCDRAK